MQRSLTILMVTNNYTPYSGGVVSSIDVTRKILQDLGHKVFVATLDFIGTGSEVGIIRIPCWFRFMYRGNRMAIPLFATNYLRAIRDHHQPDIVHVHHPWLLGSAAKRVAFERNIPVVFTYHTLYEQYLHYFPFFPFIISRQFLKASIKRFCKNITVVAPSDSIKKHIARWKIKSIVAPSGILPSFIARLPQKTSVSSGIIELLTVSRFAKEKNIQFLLEVLKKLGPAYRLTLIGYGSEQSFLENYARNILQLPAEQVRFIVKPSKDVILSWYQKAHLFIFASLSETQGLVLAEAMASGTPVIALRGPGVVDIVQSGVNGFIVDSLEEMTLKIQTVASHQQMYELLQQGALSRAQHYYPAEAIKKLLEIYGQLIRRKD